MAKRSKAKRKTKKSTPKSPSVYEVLSTPYPPSETSFCGERNTFKTAVTHPWEEYELKHRKLF